MSPQGAPIKYLENYVISIQHKVSGLADHVKLIAQNPQDKIEKACNGNNKKVVEQLPGIEYKK